MNLELVNRARALAGALTVAGLLLGVAAASASAQSSATQSALSANWSGYVVGSASDGTNESFSSVSGSWTQPSANCSSATGDASFWVGLGGAGQASGALEQVGTEVDCGSSGDISNYAWYELVPSAPVRLDLTISPGDRISGRVDVSGSTVTVSLFDHTAGASATKTMTMSNPDVSSAEWIAEAPSACDGSGNCQPLTLADFGKVSFTGASATAAGHTGTISDQSWASEPVSLSSDQGGYGGAQFLSDQLSGDAQPSGLSSDGSSFTVNYVSSGGQNSATSAAGSYGGYYGDGGGVPGAYGAYGAGGYGGYSGYTYGDGSY